MPPTSQWEHSPERLLEQINILKDRCGQLERDKDELEKEVRGLLLREAFASGKSLVFGLIGGVASSFITGLLVWAITRQR